MIVRGFYESGFRSPLTAGGAQQDGKYRTAIMKNECLR